MKKRILIGICGASASGKTLLARNLQQNLGPHKVALIQEDAYYKDLSQIPMHERHMRNFDHPQAFDHPLLLSQLRDLLEGNSIAQPVYDYKTHTRTGETRTIGPCDIIVLEGILILSDADLRSVMDIKVFVHTPADICFIRRLQRDTTERGRSVESVIEQYLHTVRPMYLQYIEPSRQYADFIVPEGGENREALDMLTEKIKTILRKNK